MNNQPPPRLHSVPPSDHDRIKTLERISQTTVDKVQSMESDVKSIAKNVDALRQDLRGVVNGGLVKGAAASGSIFFLVDMVTKQLDKAPPIATTIVLSLLAVSVPLGVIFATKRRRGDSDPPPSEA